MLIHDIVDYLTTGGMLTTFRGGIMPTTPDEVVSIYETVGMPTAHVMGNTAGQAVMEYARVQVVSRANDYETARTNAHKAFKLLDGMPTRTLNGIQYHWSRALQSPFHMGRDENDRVKVAFNVEVMKDLSTTST